jgi:AcrR family transcriptional regulator
VSDIAASDAGQEPRDRSRRRRAGGDRAGRTQILDAAVACILELGFYRASTNEIARRANVSWGAIQYYFGSREALMLASVEELNRRFTEAIGRSHVEGDTLEERIRSLYRILSKHYGHPSYMARLQILLNLQHDPNTSTVAESALDEQSRRVADNVRRLLEEVIGQEATEARGSALFHTIRGFALSVQLAESVNPDLATHDEAETVETFLVSLTATERAAQQARENRHDD